MIFTVCLRFDLCCLNELHGFGPDTNDCGIYSNAHHWNLMQTSQHFNFAVGFPPKQCELLTGQQAHNHVHLCVVNSLKVTRRITCLTPFKGIMSLSLKITMQILLSGPRSGNWGHSLQHIYHLWTYVFTSCATSQTLPSSASLPANILCICELWSSPTVANRWPLDSWVITNPLWEWLVLSQIALIRARCLSPVFAQALKSSSGFVTHRVCSG